MSKENENEDEVLEDEDELIDEEIFDEEDEDEDEDEEDDDKKSDKSKKKSDLKSKVKKLQGIAKRYRTKANKQKDKEDKQEKKVEKKDEPKGLDKSDRYFLKSEGIKTDAEIKLVEELMAETGKDVEKLVETKYFKAQLQELRDEQATKDATPSGSKRGGDSASKTSVEYWLKKGGLPTDNPELATKVVNARMKEKSNQNQFSDTSVVS